MNTRQINWETLSEKDLAVLESVGITRPAPKPVREKPSKNPLTKKRKLDCRNTCPVEHPVRVINWCACCKSSTVTEGFMRRKEENARHLSFVPDDIKGVECEVISLKSTTCIKCDEVLMELSKEQLVRLLKLHHNKELPKDEIPKRRAENHKDRCIDCEHHNIENNVCKLDTERHQEACKKYKEAE